MINLVRFDKLINVLYIVANISGMTKLHVQNYILDIFSILC